MESWELFLEVNDVGSSTGKIDPVLINEFADLTSIVEERYPRECTVP